MYKLFESWKKYLNELFVHGSPEEGSYIVAFRENIWAFSDFSEELEEPYEIEGQEFFSYNEVIDELEERSDILFGSIQNDYLFIESRSSFKFDPKSSILVKKVVKQLNLKGATYSDSLEDDEIDVEKEKIKGKIPEKVYHGTSTKYVYNIMKMGLRPGVSKTNYESIEHPEAIFFATRFGEAWEHAYHTSKKVGGEPVVLEMSIPEKDKIISDYDVDVGAENKTFNYIDRDLRDKQRDMRYNMKGKSISLSQEFGIYGYRGRVPGKFIDTFYLVLNFDENYSKRDQEKIYYKPKEHLSELDQEEMKIYIETKEEYGYGYTDYSDIEDYEEEEEEY